MGEINQSDQRGKQISALTKLIQLTQEDQLSWRSAKADSDILGISPEAAVNVFFSTEYKGRTLRLFEKRSKNLHRKPLAPPAHLSFLRSYNDPNHFEYIWTREVVLQLVDRNGASSCPFDNVSVMDDLLQAVKYQVTGARGFVDDLLDQDDAVETTQ